ncbi:MAG: hypothetical protein IJP86_08155 [Synergistaceae bacterium]|nr:hypothetical protein [Synergistaceae bacterium]
MKALSFLAAIFLLTGAAYSGENLRGEALAVLRTPDGMTLSEDSLKSGDIRQYIDQTAGTAGAVTVSVFDSLSLANKDRHIFVFMAADGKTSEELAAILKEDPNVVSASPNRKVRLPRVR